MSDPRNVRDPALGGDPALDPVAPGPSRRPTGFGPWWLLVILVALVIAAGFWGFGGYGRRGTGVDNGMANGGAVNGGTKSGSTPVMGGAAPTNAPAPTPPGNGSGR